MRDLATGRLRLDRLAAMAAPRLSSPGLRPFLAETRKSLRRHPALRPDWCVVDRLRPLDRHRDRDGRRLGQPGRNRMATIGTFEHMGDSDYLGDIFTLSLRAKNVRVVSVSRTNENAPSHRVYAGVSRSRAPHNPEVKGTPPRPERGGAGSVIATR
jgi:Protein of unknown function (DUF736)